MVSLLNMNMKTGGPLHELRTLLQQIKDELIALTQVQDQEWQQTQRRCQVDNAQLTATLEQASGDLESQRQEQQALLAEQSTLNARVRDGSLLSFFISLSQTPPPSRETEEHKTTPSTD